MTGMCGRYVLRGRKEQLAMALGLTDPLPFEEFTERPHFNVAPSQHVPVVRLDRQGHRVGRLARWGLIPAWATDLPKVRPINARAETVTTSGTFRGAFTRRRCLVPADGFYEWQRLGGGKGKRPVFVHFPDDRVFAFAGLWERWHPPGEDVVEPVDTCTIVTTTANALMKPIHDRMPVILRPQDYALWLDREADPAEAAKLMRPYAGGEMEVTPVSTLVNSPGNDVPECVKPLA